MRALRTAGRHDLVVGDLRLLAGDTPRPHVVAVAEGRSGPHARDALVVERVGETGCANRAPIAQDPCAGASWFIGREPPIGR